jgi:hypothetical protein
MGWEQRRNRRYYYRSRKLGGRVRKEYVGTGLVGLLAVRQEEQRRQRAAEARELLRRDPEAFEAAAAPARQLDRLVEALMRAALEQAGYHQPNRSTWRKKRHGRRDEE